MQGVVAKKAKTIVVILLLALIGFFFDFSPRIYEEILQAQHFIEKQEYQKAVNLYEKILKQNSNKEIEVKILYQLGDLNSIYLSKNIEGIKYYEKIMRITDDPLWSVRTQERIAEIYFTYLRNYKKASSIYKKLKEFTPPLKKQNFYQFRYARSLLKLDLLSEAQGSFKEITKNKKHKYYINAFYYLGLANFKKNKWKKAISFWKQYLNKEKRNDGVIRVKFLMANAYEMLEELKQAYNIYYSILGEYPNTEVIQNRLNGIYQRRIARKR